MGSFFSKTSNILIVVGIVLFVLGIFSLPGTRVGSRAVIVRGGPRERIAILITILGMMLAIVGIILKFAFAL